MFGWINDCTECLVVNKFGEDTWHRIKEVANCTVVDGGFCRYKYYPDSDTVDLVVAASQVLGISVDDVLHAFGDYFIDYVQDNGYSNVLECLGKNLRDWLSNLNSLHDHLQASYPKGFVAPVFWSEDDESGTSDGSNAILVHYYSQRGSLLVPLVVGLLKKLARVYFEIEINLEQLALQDEEIEKIPEEAETDEPPKTHKHTTWRVTSANPEEAHKLRGKRAQNFKSTGSVGTITTAPSSRGKYERTFQEGGDQAAFLRVEELVQRCFFEQDCELFHALTLEQYAFLVEYWKTESIPTPGGGDRCMCYELWGMEDNEPDSWPTLNDLPPALRPGTIRSDKFGGKRPATGAYPPLNLSENTQRKDSILQSFPPIIRVINALDTSKSLDMTFAMEAINSPHNTLAHVVAPKLEEAGVTCFDDDVTSRIEIGDLEVQWLVHLSNSDEDDTDWRYRTPAAFHTLTQEDLSCTTLQHLYDLAAGAKLDPIPLFVQVSEAIAIDDDEEDI